MKSIWGYIISINMSDRIDIKLMRLSKRNAKILALLAIVLEINGYFGPSGSGITKEDIVWFFVCIPFATPMIYELIFSCHPCRLIIENNIITAERLIFKPIILPLVNVDDIRTNGLRAWGISTGHEEVYVIKYGRKQIFLDPHGFKYAEVNLDKFAFELRDMVKEAKSKDQ